MWRPGLVVLTECLARCTGSIRQAAIIASVVGATLMDLLLLWLTWRCFGRAAWAAVLVVLFLPFSASAILLSMAVGQGPEPWAAACTLGGLTLLVEGLARRSLALTLLAGLVAGSAEIFRTGNVLLFMAPLGTLMLAGLYRRSFKDASLGAASFAAYAAASFLIGQLSGSPVNKAVANLWGNLVEHQGQIVRLPHPNGGEQVNFLGGLELVPGTNETYYDNIVRRCHSMSGRAFLEAHGCDIGALYVERLAKMVAEGASGLRAVAGEWLLVLFVLGLVAGMVCPSEGMPATVALAAGFTGHFLGPVVLLCGAGPTHYLFPALPLLVIVAGRGAVAVGEWVFHRFQRMNAGVPQPLTLVPRALLASAAVSLAWFTAMFYSGAIASVRDEYLKAKQEQEHIDALKLDGLKVAVRHMTWFVDRDVETMLLPYATVPELEEYTRVHRLDGLLFRVKARHPFLYVTPYASSDAFEEALQQSAWFGPCESAGPWRWYPVRYPLRAGLREVQS
jgi:hypothetical protein